MPEIVNAPLIFVFVDDLIDGGTTRIEVIEAAATYIGVRERYSNVLVRSTVINALTGNGGGWPPIIEMDGWKRKKGNSRHE